ncbi:hypothetical protein C8J57DRAFT_1225143 [Mycena rebaudengoi]|nr:hypothetical protein C8J57DRAFT_1225143 [Mycena rebaudengoi]
MAPPVEHPTRELRGKELSKQPRDSMNNNLALRNPTLLQRTSQSGKALVRGPQSPTKDDSSALFPAAKHTIHHEPTLRSSDDDEYDLALCHRYRVPQESPALVDRLRPSSEFCPVTLPGYGTGLEVHEGGGVSEEDTSVAEDTIRTTTETERRENEPPYTHRFPTEEHYMQSQSGRIWVDALPAYLEARRHPPVLLDYDDAYLHSENVIIQVDKRGVERVFEIICSPRNRLTEGMTLECHGCLFGGWVIEEITGQDDQHIYMRCVNNVLYEIAEIRMLHHYRYRATWRDQARHWAHRMAPCLFMEWD